MTFSPRATQLMGALDQLIADLDAPIARIAAAYDINSPLDPQAVMQDINLIDKTALGFRTLMDSVALGPDAPLDPNGPAVPRATVPWQVMKTKTLHVQNQVAKWTIIKSWVLRTLTCGAQPLFPDLPDQDSAVTAQQSTADRIFNILHAYLNPNAREDGATDKGGYADIALPQGDFIRQIYAARRLTMAQRLGHPARFLDVGCGGGLKVLSASEYFPAAEGFDFVSSYVEAAQPLMRMTDPKARVFEADGLTFERYADYDVIYFYRPLSDEALLKQLEVQIATNAKPGTLLIAPYDSIVAHHRDLGCAHVAGRIYLAHATDAQANALRERAERIGPHGPAAFSDASLYWSPILDALSDTGFHCRPIM